MSRLLKWLRFIRTSDAPRIESFHLAFTGMKYEGDHVIGVYTSDNLARIALLDQHRDDTEQQARSDWYVVHEMEPNTGRVFKETVLIDYTEGIGCT